MTTDKPALSFNLPFNQSSHYWLGVFPADGSDSLSSALCAYGMKPYAATNGYLLRLNSPWEKSWKEIRHILTTHAAEEGVHIVLIAGEAEPAAEEIAGGRKPLALIDTLAASLWLGEAMIEDKLVCYMQPVLDKRSKVFGYEAFARVETGNEPIGGGKIIEASRGLNVEYMLDRHLHVKAISSFISSDLEGFLFINFVPGFIHRPEKYLEGLTDAAKACGMPAKQIVLDFTRAETPSDLTQLKSIVDYCRSKGYSLSLDDVASIPKAKKILESVRPDFIKLDISLVRGALVAAQYNTICELVRLAHGSGVTVLAEGVETEEIHRELQKANVDLFQGYLFSPPVAISHLRKAAG